MFAISGTMSWDPSERDTIVKTLIPLCAASRQEEGNVDYCGLRTSRNPGPSTSSSSGRSEDTFDSHCQSPGYLSFMRELHAVDQGRVGVAPRDLRLPQPRLSTHRRWRIRCMTCRRCGSWWSGGRRSRRIGRCCWMSRTGGSPSRSSRRWAERTAAGFYELGVRESTAVTWQLPTRMETVVASMALSRLGAVQNPIIPIYRQREVGFLLRETGAEWFLVPGRWRGFDYREMADGFGQGDGVAAGGDGGV